MPSTKSSHNNKDNISKPNIDMELTMPWALATQRLTMIEYKVHSLTYLGGTSFLSCMWHKFHNGAVDLWTQELYLDWCFIINLYSSNDMKKSWNKICQSIISSPNAHVLLENKLEMGAYHLNYSGISHLFYVRICHPSTMLLWQGPLQERSRYQK